MMADSPPADLLASVDSVRVVVGDVFAKKAS
jgi:hypothetical protein